MKKIVKFLFFLERDFHLAILKPLIKHIYKFKLGEVHFYAPFSDKTNLAEKLMLEIQDIELPVHIINNPWAWKPDITFMADFSYQYVEDLGKIVNIGHGTICKGWFFSTNRISQRENCADLICVPGTIHKERLDIQVYKPIEVTGIPKLDNCFNGTLNKEELYRKFDLCPNIKTVLLAPTFNEEFSILTYLRDINTRDLFPKNINLIVKLHGVTNPEYWKEAFNWAYFADTYDTDELFFISDILITDVSSIIYEFISLGKPVLLFDSPKQKEYINYNENDLEWIYRDVGERFNDVSKIAEILEAIDCESYKHENQNNIASKFISVTDGSATEKVINAALKLLNDDYFDPVSIFNTTELGRNQFVPYRENGDTTELGTNKCVPYRIEKEEEYILFLHPDYELSPQFKNLMLNQIKNNNNVGLVAPLIFDDTLHLQQVNFRVKFEGNNDFSNLSLKLNYAFSGHCKDIDFVLPYCFLVRRDMLNIDFSDPLNTKICMYELIANVLKNKLRVVIAYDCLIRKKIS